VTEHVVQDLQDVTIARLGLHGDGVAETPGGAVFVPFVLAGERVRVDVAGERARLVEVLEASPARIAPVCGHFTVCGGCALQHMGRDEERSWKSALVAAAFRHQGIEAPLQPMIAAGTAERRRAVFAARRTRAGAILGFHAPCSHDIVDLAECPILLDGISSRLPALRALVAPLLSRSGEARVTVVAAGNGIDVAIADGKPEVSVAERGEIAAHARAAQVLRLSIGSDIVYAGGEPVIRFGTVAVTPPPGVFLQAVAGVEARMAALIVTAVGKAKRVADLFCGVGTFSFPLAAKAEVLAVDGNRVAIGALEAAFKRAQGIKPVRTKVRDLFSEPLSVKELEPFDAVVFDPPRAGAQTQAARLAKSKVATIVAVSCAPATLARDVRTLLEGGFVLEAVTPVDQFEFSSHVEAIAVLRRPKR
jgi:23S rRNA (uracil1939-C5)-methyltransferase